MIKLQVFKDIYIYVNVSVCSHMVSKILYIYIYMDDGIEIYTKNCVDFVCKKARGFRRKSYISPWVVMVLRVLHKTFLNNYINMF